MNMMKKTGGFTLVELIVVIAILAILAAVAVPAYSGYITKANEAADYTQLDSMKTAVVFAVAEKDPAVSVTSAKITFTDLTKVEVTVNPTSTKVPAMVDISEFVDMTKYVAKSEATGATWYNKAAGATIPDGAKDGWNLTKPAK